MVQFQFINYIFLTSIKKIIKIDLLNLNKDTKKKYLNISIVP